MIVYAHLFKCLEPILVIVSTLTIGDPCKFAFTMIALLFHFVRFQFNRRSRTFNLFSRSNNSWHRRPILTIMCSFNYIKYRRKSISSFTKSLSFSNGNNPSTNNSSVPNGKLNILECNGSIDSSTNWSRSEDFNRDDPRAFRQWLTAFLININYSYFFYSTAQEHMDLNENSSCWLLIQAILVRCLPQNLIVHDQQWLSTWVWRESRITSNALSCKH